MPHLHFLLSDGPKNLEWGFECPVAPSPGDNVDLAVCEPDRSDAHCEIIRCKVVSRTWFYDYYSTQGDTVEIQIVTTEEIPTGYVPDSESWPALHHGQRERELNEQLKGI